MFDIDKLIRDVVGGPDYIHGRALKNHRRRHSRDPAFLGWIDFENGRASVGMWPHTGDDGKLDTSHWTLSLKPFGKKVRAYSYGEVVKNDDRRANVAPDFMGDLEWGGGSYSTAIWFNPPSEDGKQSYFAIRLLPQKKPKI